MHWGHLSSAICFCNFVATFSNYRFTVLLQLASSDFILSLTFKRILPKSSTAFAGTARYKTSTWSVCKCFSAAFTHSSRSSCLKFAGNIFSVILNWSLNINRFIRMKLSEWKIKRERERERETDREGERLANDYPEVVRYFPV